MISNICELNKDLTCLEAVLAEIESQGEHDEKTGQHSRQGYTGFFHGNNPPGLTRD